MLNPSKNNLKNVKTESIYGRTNIVGGPYATASYIDLLKDKNVDLAVIAEGELTLKEILYEMLTNNYNFPDKKVLQKIQGIAFRNNN